MPIINGQGRIGVRVSPTVYPSEFITVWKTDNAGTTASNQISIGTTYGTHNLLVDWGDGTTSTITGYGTPAVQHTYATAGTYTVKMSGTFPGFIQNGDRLKLLQVANWGSKAWTSMQGAFQSCTNLTITAQDVPNFSACTNMSSMFQSCTSITSIPKIKNWVMSNVTNIDGMFVGCTGLSSLDLTGWDLRKVTTFMYSYGPFQGCTNLVTLNVTGWQLPTATTYSFQQLFHGCTKLATITGIGGWDVSKCTNMGSMFYQCNALTSVDLSTWNPISVTNTNNMFTNCQGLTSVNLSNWNLPVCTNLSYMFQQSKVTSVNLTGWVLNTTSSVNMAYMFYACSSLTTLTGFNTLNTSKVTSLEGTFSYCKLSSFDMSGMNFSSCTTFNSTFYGCGSLTSVNVSGMTLNTTSNVILNSMFRDSTSLTTITGLNTLNMSKVTSVGNMLQNIKVSTLDLSNWDLSSCTNFNYFIVNNPNLTTVNTTGWILNTTSNIQNAYMIASCGNLTTISGTETWNTSKFTSFNESFRDLYKLSTFNMSNWNLSGVTSMTNMFSNNVLMNNVNMSGVTLNTTTSLAMNNTFFNCNSLTTVIGLKELNMSKVTTLSNAFRGTLLNADLSNWNLSSCTDFSYMFSYKATGSNYTLNVSNWTLNSTSNINMSGMFTYGGTLSVSGLSTWNVTRVNNFSVFLDIATLPTTEYSNMLVAWDALDLTNNLSFHGGYSKYNAAGQTARSSIIANDVWTISDGGLQP